jgi:NADH-quinone oxidoreductase subunit A
MMPGEFVPTNYLPILIFIAIALAFGGVTLLLGKILRPSRIYKAKLTPYESGSLPFSDARAPFPLRYYIIAMIFVIFDIETVFLYPWAVVYNELKLFGLIEMALFILVLLVGYFYAWKKGALEWD